MSKIDLSSFEDVTTQLSVIRERVNSPGYLVGQAARNPSAAVLSLRYDVARLAEAVDELAHLTRDKLAEAAAGR